MRVSTSAYIVASVIVASQLSAAGPVTFLPDCQNGPLSKNKVCDVTAAPAARAAALIRAMKIDEKLLQIKRYGLENWHLDSMLTVTQQCNRRRTTWATSIQCT